MVIIGLETGEFHNLISALFGRYNVGEKVSGKHLTRRTRRTNFADCSQLLSNLGVQILRQTFTPYRNPTLLLFCLRFPFES